MLLEMVLGPIYVIFAYGEMPTSLDWMLAGVILSALSIDHLVPLVSARSMVTPSTDVV